jgi:GTP-binding protein
MDQLPPDTGREVAFAGRSNTGKSTVINTLCKQKALARTSRTPGRTQQLIVFEIDEQRRLVDLPGFGYARVPRALRTHWDRIIPTYLERRRSLVGLVLVTDARHALKPVEQGLLAWCEAAEVPAHLLLNKSDKLNRSQARTALARASEAVAALKLDGSVQLFSTLAKDGVDEARARVAAWLDDV